MIKKFVQIINEIAFAGNIGFQEMTQFYQTATPSQIKEMEAIIKASDWKGFKKLIKKVLNVSLK